MLSSVAVLTEHCKLDWRRDPESNWATRICNPLHNRFAIAPNLPEKMEAFLLPFFVFGAGEESRTLDLNLGKVALYQLSYSRKYKETTLHY